MTPIEDLQYAARTFPCSANAQACVFLYFMPCCLAQSKALSSVQTKHQFIVQKEGPEKALSIWKWSAITNKRLTGNENSIADRKQATDHKHLRPARPHHRRLSDAVIHPIGEVDSVSSSGSLRCRRRPEHVTSRRPYHCGLSDPITDLDRLIILASQPSNRALSWLGGECAAPQQARQYQSAPFGWCGKHSVALLTLGRRTKTSCTRRMIASRAVSTQKGQL